MYNNVTNACDEFNKTLLKNYEYCKMYRLTDKFCVFYCCFQMLQSFWFQICTVLFNMISILKTVYLQLKLFNFYYSDA